MRRRKILNVGCMNDHEQHQSDRVGNDVTFAALDQSFRRHNCKHGHFPWF